MKYPVVRGEIVRGLVLYKPAASTSVSITEVPCSVGEIVRGLVLYKPAASTSVSIAEVPCNAR